MQCLAMYRSYHLSAFINKFFQEGIFLICWRSLMSYQSMKGWISNYYRPISILFCFAKIFQQIMYARLIKFLFTFMNSLWLCGFILYKWCTFGNPKSYIWIIDNERVIAGLLFNLSQTFDWVHHKRLLNKLALQGIMGLTSRKQIIQIRSNKSTTSSEIINTT